MKGNEGCLVHIAVSVDFSSLSLLKWSCMSLFSFILNLLLVLVVCFL